MNYFGIYDERRVLNLSLKGKNTILIRIFEPNNKNTPPKILNESNYKNILELSIFDYVNPPKQDELNITFKKINDFILNNHFDEIIIHCSLGLSRSPAIMLCVAKILNNNNLEQTVKENFKYYNKFIVEAFEKYPYTMKKDFNNELFECINEKKIPTTEFGFDLEEIVINHNMLKDNDIDIKKRVKTI